VPAPTAPPRTKEQADFHEAVGYHARYSLGREFADLTSREVYTAVALAVRDWAVEGLLRSERRYVHAGAKRACYLSMEFLTGRLLINNLINLGLYDRCREALGEMGADLEALAECEPDPALGNGGLGRLAACFLDSLATHDMPGFGYGINYEFGLFRQAIDNGHQRERPDHWLAGGTPWQIARPDEACMVPLYGRVEHGSDALGGYNPMWLDWQVVVGVPHDVPIVGYGGKTVNFLRLFSARSSADFDMAVFNQGDYMRAVEQKVRSETISKVLYPSDTVEAGRELRLVQEYFLVACAVGDILRRFLRSRAGHAGGDGHGGLHDLASHVAIQLNDTHPALAVAELMRALVDEHQVDWERAWSITTQTLGFTNHTLLPEALEKWPVPLLARVLPRHLQIIDEINRRFLQEVATAWPGDEGRLRRMSIIEEVEPKQVRMAHLAIVGSHSINGVARLHSDLLKSALLPDFHALWPSKFSNKTNGITQRRWLLAANPGLADLVTRSIGDGWITDLRELRRLEPCAADAGFQQEFLAVKSANKDRLARVIADQCRVAVDPGSLFDVQSKRIHEYKRQLLNVMHVIHLYLGLVEDGADSPVARTVVFAGKSAPGYWAAKQIIRLIHAVAEVVNRDPRVGGRLKVVFLPDYRVSLAERLIPAADLSEQISTAGTEASGTGNMKFALNGAMTIGTLDGANIEIREEVGAENFFMFGLTIEEAQALRAGGRYRPWDQYHRSPVVRRVMDAINGDMFCKDDPGLFRWIFDSLLEGGDRYLHLADLDSYVEAQRRAAEAFADRPRWAEMAILNVARIGKFSSDRTIAEYAEQIWGIRSVR
jgi:starch phosphorylase